MTTIESIPEDSARGWVPSVLDDFGARLALVRHRMRWNVKEAALACGLPAASWRGWELEGRPPRDYLGTVTRIARRTGCDMVWLAGFPVTAKRDQNAWDWPNSDGPWAPRGSNPQPTDYLDAGSELQLAS
jgi:hypothetical protein